ncbi:MAG: nucleotidyltransferase family protein [Candidatus Aminicenantes bacterium]|nr:nucleotidyltransferase family protein [Candidatus Aminicenantes bacterium]
MKEENKTFSLEPELELLLLSITLPGKQAAAPWCSRAAAEILKKEIDWAKLRQFAVYHRVLPLFYKRLKDLDISLLPEAEMKRIKALDKENTLNNLRQAAKLHRVLDILSRGEVTAIAFKGPVLAVQAYGDLSMRTFVDLDLLVRGEDFGTVYDLLTAAGLRSSFPLDEKKKRLWVRFHRSLEFFDDTSVVDVHQQIFPGQAKTGFAGRVRQNRSTAALLSRQVPVLSAEHALLVLCLHGTKDNWSFLRYPAEIAHLIDSFPDLDWQALTADARETGSLPMLAVGLFLARQVCGLQLPAGVLRAAGLDVRSGKPAAEYLGSLLAGDSTAQPKIGKIYEVKALLKAMDSNANRAKHLIHFLFVPTPLDWAAIKLPTFLYPLYFLVRPLRLLFKLLTGRGF